LSIIISVLTSPGPPCIFWMGGLSHPAFNPGAPVKWVILVAMGIVAGLGGIASANITSGAMRVYLNASPNAQFWGGLGGFILGAALIAVAQMLLYRWIYPATAG